MSPRVDKEIERVTKLGQTPKTIIVGDDLYDEISAEQNLPIIAAQAGSGEDTPTFTDKPVTEYKGVKVVRMSDVPKDYLEILT